MGRRKVKSSIKVMRPRRNKVSKEKHNTCYRSRPQQCRQDKEIENKLKKRMSVMDNLLHQQMHGKITISEKLVAKYLKELREMKVHCTREDLKQVNEKLILCMEICLTPDENGKEMNCSDGAIQTNKIIIITDNPLKDFPQNNILPSKNTLITSHTIGKQNGEEFNKLNTNVDQIIIPDTQVKELFPNKSTLHNDINTNTFSSYGNEIIKTGNTPVLRSSQSTPSNIDIQEIVGQDMDEFTNAGNISYIANEEMNNISNGQNVIEKSINTVNDSENTDSMMKDIFNYTENHSTRRISVASNPGIIASQSVNPYGEVIQGNSNSTEPSNYVNYAASEYYSNAVLESQSLLKEQEKYDVGPTEINVHCINNISTDKTLIHTEDASESILGFNHYSLQRSSQLHNRETIEDSIGLREILKDKPKSEKTKVKNNLQITENVTGCLSKKQKMLEQTNIVDVEESNYINDNMSNLYISSKTDMKPSFNGNQTNVCVGNKDCSSSSRQQTNTDSMTECENFIPTQTKTSETQKSTVDPTKMTLKTTEHCDWSSLMNLKWLKNVKYIRTVEEGELFSACNVPDSFWNDDSVPLELIKEFD